jgi:hypothetical protein
MHIDARRSVVKRLESHSLHTQTTVATSIGDKPMFS